MRRRSGCSPAINEKPGRDPLVSRYQYIGVIFVLLIAAQLYSTASGSRRPALIAVLRGHRARRLQQRQLPASGLQLYLNTSQIERADLAAVEIGRDTIDPGFVLADDIARTANVHIEVGAVPVGSRCVRLARLRRGGACGNHPDAQRSAADSVFAAGLGVTSVAGATPSRTDCQTVEVAGGQPVWSIWRRAARPCSTAVRRLSTWRCDVSATASTSRLDVVAPAAARTIDDPHRSLVAPVATGAQR